MTDNQEKSAEVEVIETPLPFRDKIALEIFLGLVLAIIVLYGFAYNDWYSSVFALIGPLMLVFYTRSEWYDALIVGHRFYDELTESSIVLVLFFSSVWFLPVFFEPLGFIISFILPLVVTSVICLIFLVGFRKYSRRAIGITTEGTEFSKDFMKIFLIVNVVLAILRLALYSGSLFTQPEVLFQILALSFFVFALPVGIAEELVFRGVIQPRLVAKTKSRIMGISITSLIFAAGHVFAVWQTATFLPGGLLQAFLIAIVTRLPVGILLGMVWDMSHNLIPPVTMHVIYNTIAYLLVAASYLGG